MSTWEKELNDNAWCPQYLYVYRTSFPALIVNKFMKISITVMMIVKKRVMGKVIMRRKTIMRTNMIKFKVMSVIVI